MTHSLRTWLALGLVAAITAPAAACAGAWFAAGAWQTSRERSRATEARQLLASSSLDSDTDRKALSARLAELGVEAQVDPEFKPTDRSTIAEEKAKAVKALGPWFITPGLEALEQSPGYKARIDTDFITSNVPLPGAAGTLYVRRESAAAGWGIALAAAAGALAAVLVLAVSLLQRWVLRPLARLAADAERIAGGELAVEPVATRAREVAQVGDALGGMAGALETALGSGRARAPLSHHSHRPRPAHAAVHPARVAGGDRARHRRRRLARSRPGQGRPP